MNHRLEKLDEAIDHMDKCDNFLTMMPIFPIALGPDAERLVSQINEHGKPTSLGKAVQNRMILDLGIVRAALTLLDQCVDCQSNGRSTNIIYQLRALEQDLIYRIGQ